MGSRIPNLDMFVNSYIQPMMRAYLFKDYKTAAHILFSFNAFLVPFNFDIKLTGPDGQEERLKEPTFGIQKCKGEQETLRHYEIYFNTFNPYLTRQLGLWINKVVQEIIEENTMMRSN